MMLPRENGEWVKFEEIKEHLPAANTTQAEIALCIEKLKLVRSLCMGSLFVTVNDNLDAVIAKLSANTAHTDISLWEVAEWANDNCSPDQAAEFESIIHMWEKAQQQ
jgi:hypothetical protein